MSYTLVYRPPRRPVSIIAASSGFPDASNTGVQAGRSLTPVTSLVINSPGIYEDLDCTGNSVEINASNVTLRNCRAHTVPAACIYVAAGKTGVVIEYCDIDGGGESGIKGIWIDGANGTIVRYCDISASEDGIYFFADNVEIRDNYIHDLTTAGVDPHHDCLQFAGSGIIIDHNSLIGTADANSCLQFGNGTDTIIATVNNNLLRPGAALFPINMNDGAVDHETMTFTNNVIEQGTVGGSPPQKYITYNFRSPDVWTGNTDYITSAIIPLP